MPERKTEEEQVGRPELHSRVQGTWPGPGIEEQVTSALPASTYIFEHLRSNVTMPLGMGEHLPRVHKALGSVPGTSNQ